MEQMGKKEMDKALSEYPMISPTNRSQWEVVDAQRRAFLQAAQEEFSLDWLGALSWWLRYRKFVCGRTREANTYTAREFFDNQHEARYVDSQIGPN